MPTEHLPRQRSNDTTERPNIWRRYDGDDWLAFDALPTAVRRRMHEHAYDAWTVNALILWRRFRRQAASSARGERRLLNHLQDCEALEFEAFAEAYARRWGGSLPHRAARATVLRYDALPSRAATERDGGSPSQAAAAGSMGTAAGIGPGRGRW